MTATPSEQLPARVVHFVLTGGPSAGKTTATSHLVEQLSARGWRVLLVPEAATILISGGVADIGHLAATDRARYLDVQRGLIGIQISLRERFDTLARSLGGKVVVLHDRGVGDCAAYMSATEFETVLGDLDLNPADAFALYDCVLHLRSAAVARGDYDGSDYTTDNNAARFETAAEAATLDEATLAGWTGHPHLNIVASATSFALKLARVLAAALAALGDPEPLEIERKFALTHAPDFTHPVLASAVYVDIEQVYLPSVGPDEQRVRARTLAGVTTYAHASKTDVGEGVRIEVETVIDQLAYRMLSGLRDPETETLHKRRWMFVVGDLRFELDHITAPIDQWLLEVELVDPEDEVVVPDFVPSCIEVTEDRTWRNRALASVSIERTPLNAARGA